MYEGDDGKAVILAVQPPHARAGGAVEPVGPEVRARLERVLATIA